MRIDISFNAGSCNGFFKIIAVNGNDEHVFDGIIKGLNKISLDVTAGDLELRFTGKDNKKDTQVVDGKIVRDKFIDISSVSIGGFKLERYHLYHHFFDPYISRDITHVILIPSADELLYWYTRIIEKHVTANQ